METLYQVLIILAGAITCHGMYFLCRYVLLPGRVLELDSIKGEKPNKDGHAVVVVSEKIVGLFMSSVCGLSGLAMMWQTHYDVVHAKTAILLPTTLYIYWYFIHDTFAMYESFKMSRQGTSCTSFKDTFYGFLNQKKMFIFHHVVFILVAIPFAHGKATNNVGEGLIAFVFAMEISTPFISLHFIYDHTPYKDTILQQINGIIFIIVFFIVRIASIPYIYWLYAQQYHNGNLYSAIARLEWYCHTPAALMFTLQFLWFCAAVSKVLRGVQRLYSNKNKQKSQ